MDGWFVGKMGLGMNSWIEEVRVTLTSGNTILILDIE